VALTVGKLEGLADMPLRDQADVPAERRPGWNCHPGSAEFGGHISGSARIADEAALHHDRSIEPEYPSQREGDGDAAGRIDSTYRTAVVRSSGSETTYRIVPSGPMKKWVGSAYPRHARKTCPETSAPIV
jgi:hypothetical protein